MLATYLAGCSVIHFENGPVTPNPVPDPGFDWSLGLFSDESDDAYAGQYDAASGVRYDRWSHHMTFSLAEISNPLQTKVECAGLEWNQFTTKITFWDGLIGLVDNALLFNASAAWLDLWSPWSIEYSCRDKRYR